MTGAESAGARAPRFMVKIAQADVPHLDMEQEARQLAITPPHLRDARSKGDPSLGSGAIYPIPLSEIVVPPFMPPDHWPRVFGLDVGWKRTAAVWGAIDPTDGCVWLYSEYYAGQREVAIHADAIKARGAWIPGVVDPAARGRSQADGRNLMGMYVNDFGLKLKAADNSVSTGIELMFELLATQRLRVSAAMQNWQSEYRFYRRDEKGAIVKEDDHLLDATRYLVMSGRSIAITKAEADVRARSPVERHMSRPADERLGF